jgi:hypothetical protein
MKKINQKNSCKYHLKIAVLAISLFAIPGLVFSGVPTDFSRQAGGKGGAPFVEMVAPYGVISGITIRSGNLIDNIQLIYKYKNKNNIVGSSHGGSGGRSKTFRLRKGEYITELGGTYDKYVNSIYIKTNKGGKERWGRQGKRRFKFVGTKNSPIQGVWGRSGALLDAIGVIKKSKINKSNVKTVKINLKAFKLDPDRVGIRGESCDSCENMTNPIYPAFTSNDDLEFWKKQNDSLRKIVRKLANSTSQFSSYINEVERNHCNGVMYCEIDTRVDLINKTMDAK